MCCLGTDYKQNNRLCICVSLFELEFKSPIMSANIWSSTQSVGLVHNVIPLSNGKVFVVFVALPSFFCNRDLPIHDFFSDLL